MVHPPAGMILHPGTITLSRHGRVNSGMAGGDLDGDLNFAIFWADLNLFMDITEPFVRALPSAEWKAEDCIHCHGRLPTSVIFRSSGMKWTIHCDRIH